MVKRYPVKTLVAGMAAAGLILFLTGCGPGLPRDLRDKAKAIPQIVKEAGSRVDDLQNRYNSLEKTSEFKAVEPFAVKENWVRKFQLARDELSRANAVFDRDLKPLVKKNTPELASRVKQEITRIQQVIQDAEDLARAPVSRYTLIKDSIQNADALAPRAETHADKIQRIASGIQNTVMAKALADFPGLSEKIYARFAPLSQLDTQSRDHLTVVKTEYASHRSGSNPDYAAFADSSQALDAGLKQALAHETGFSGQMAQLYTSYTKILKDMKEDYFVTIKRESWDENSDYYDPKFATYQRQVSPELYEALTAENVDTIAVITAGFTGSKFSSKIGDLWKELAINPAEHWPGRGHNAASFWVEDSREAYFHKYLLEQEAETRETDWEPVDPDVYDANFEYLGMAILAKPYGVFEEDRDVQAAPPGMAYVGNDKYGEWKTDGSGNSFWSWYGKYAMFSMLFNSRPSFYGYNSWNGWNSGYRNSRPYFGETQNGIRQYGTSGTAVKQSPGFQSSNFARTGGFKSQTASVRGAASGLRGGGPNSKGK